MSCSFEADLCPETRTPRIRFNFPNGLSASVVLRAPTGDEYLFLMASMAVCPIGEWGTGKTEILGNELSAEEVAHWLVGTAMKVPAS